MKAPASDWYKQIWSLSIKDMSWTESTGLQVDFITSLLGLSGGERILDLACGFGRHSLEFARRGFTVTGVDITEDYIDDATRVARQEQLSAEFICDDIRNVSFNSEFDVVLSVADGAIGYLENDQENAKLFDRIAGALKPGGKHFLDVCRAEYAETHFPMRNWEIGEKSLSLPEFDWDPEARRMLYGGWGLTFGEIAQPPESTAAHSSTRLYSLEELTQLYADRGMSIVETRSGYADRQVTCNDMQVQLYAQKGAP